MFFRDPVTKCVGIFFAVPSAVPGFFTELLQRKQEFPMFCKLEMYAEIAYNILYVFMLGEQ